MHILYSFTNEFVANTYTLYTVLYFTVIEFLGKIQEDMLIQIFFTGARLQLAAQKDKNKPANCPFPFCWLYKPS